MIDKLNSQLTSAARQIPDFLNKNRYYIGAVLILLIFSISIFRIDSLSSPDINQDSYNAGLLELEKVEFNTSAIDRINDLDKRTVNVSENIDDDRNNPF